MRNFLTNLIVFALTLTRWALLLFLFVTLFGLIVPYISNIHTYTYLQPVISWEFFINQTVKNDIPTQIAGFDLSRLITLVITVILMDIVRSLSEKLEFMEQKGRMMKELEHIQQAYKAPGQKDKIALLESKMQQATLSSGKNRQDLLREFSNLKKELEKIGRDFAFLAIDVVDSTGMKIDEDPTIVELDFLQYHDYVEAKFKEHRLVRAAWTPDGVMACFNTVDDAVYTAQAIINGLDHFNRHVKSMRRDFVVRCGVNGGHVNYDESTPLEQFSDRTIDIAGHMQKYASPNSIFIAKTIVSSIKARDSFAPVERVVDGLEVCEWVKADASAK